ncbi:hypothetical protein Pcinc_021906 [Petrolisthes cinctipes]|uniref:Uncharacterized protein n=1 Tax=Petrolisthes cinctipes TaxID=88211 RepID=A0AAE1KGS2_PETCI|nr:hypothetical protein Pcinc_021906 [Petrolisthes cinctipes]
MEFPTVSQPQEEHGALPEQRNDIPYVSRYKDHINETRIQEVGRSCRRKFSCLVGDCCPVFHKRSVARLLLERAYESLIKQRKHPFPKQPTKGRGRRLRRKRRLYNRAQGVRRKPSPINHSLEYSGPSDLLHHHP